MINIFVFFPLLGWNFLTYLCIVAGPEKYVGNVGIILLWKERRVQICRTRGTDYQKRISAYKFQVVIRIEINSMGFPKML